MKCFACKEEIAGPETDVNFQLDETHELSAWCPLCGACVRIFDQEDDSVEFVRVVFERACGGGE